MGNGVFRAGTSRGEVLVRRDGHGFQVFLQMAQPLPAEAQVAAQVAEFSLQGGEEMLQRAEVFLVEALAGKCRQLGDEVTQQAAIGPAAKQSKAAAAGHAVGQGGIDLAPDVAGGTCLARQPTIEDIGEGNTHIQQEKARPRMRQSSMMRVDEEPDKQRNTRQPRQGKAARSHSVQGLQERIRPLLICCHAGGCEGVHVGEQSTHCS